MCFYFCFFEGARSRGPNHQPVIFVVFFVKVGLAFFQTTMNRASLISSEEVIRLLDNDLSVHLGCTFAMTTRPAILKPFPQWKHQKPEEGSKGSCLSLIVRCYGRHSAIIAKSEFPTWQPLLVGKADEACATSDALGNGT